MKWRIDYNLQAEIDIRKDDCKREAPHCHITRNGRRVAQVFLSPIRIESGHDLEHNEIRNVLDAVERNCNQMLKEYIRIRDE